MVWKPSIAFKLTHPISVLWGWFGNLLTLMWPKCCLSTEAPLRYPLPAGRWCISHPVDFGLYPQPQPHTLEVAKLWQLFLPLLRSHGGTQKLLLTKAFPQTVPKATYSLNNPFSSNYRTLVSDSPWYLLAHLFSMLLLGNGVRWHTTHLLHQNLLLLSLAITF